MRASSVWTGIPGCLFRLTVVWHANIKVWPEQWLSTVTRKSHIMLSKDKKVSYRATPNTLSKTLYTQPT